jgi:hypothetical protein
MTSTEIVRGELRRFLRSSEPEVICVTGDWGVGKTYTWQEELNEARARNQIGLKRYSYASLFGISSLDALKMAVFENLEFLDAPPESYVDRGVDLIKGLAAKAAKFSQLSQGLPAIGQMLSKAGPLFFSAVQSQIVCIDDLERRGVGLELRDVFGLISFLREQRACKIVLLLNDEKLENDRADFDTHFEKVIDARLVFSPTAGEALDIAFRSDDHFTALLRKYCEALKISNIRVIKKIERLVRQIIPHLSTYSSEIARQAVHSLVLFGWSKFQPSEAPPLDYYRVSSTARYLERRRSKQAASPEDEKWSTLLSDYQFSNTDECDAQLMKFVDSGVLDIAAIASRAQEQDQKLKLQASAGSLEKAWRPFHDSFDENTDQVVASIVGALRANVAIMSLSNLDSAVGVLYELERSSEAKEVLDWFVAKRELEFWDPSRDPFATAERFHPAILEIIAERNEAAATVAAASFDPEAELIKAAQTFNEQSLKKLALVPIEEYYRMIKSKQGDEMRKIILSGLEFRRISNASLDMVEIVRRVEEALKMIASESKLNAIRVGRYGVTP